MSELKVGGILIYDRYGKCISRHQACTLIPPQYITTNDPRFVVYIKTKSMVRRLSKSNNTPHNAVPISMFNARYKVKN